MAVTATWHPELKLYLFAVTTPTVLPSTVGPYDTYVLESPALTGPFRLVSYMPKFGQQAVSAVLTTVASSHVV